MRYKVKKKDGEATRDPLEFLPLDMALAHLEAQNIDKRTKAVLAALLKRIG